MSKENTMSNVPTPRSEEKQWAAEIVELINKLTPDIQGKAFDAGWFMLYERLDSAARELAAAKEELSRLNNLDVDYAMTCNKLAQALSDKRELVEALRAWHDWWQLDSVGHGQRGEIFTNTEAILAKHKEQP